MWMMYIIETTNHFRCIDLAITSAKTKLTESLIKQFHYTLKNNTSDQEKTWFRVGDYKLLVNEVGGLDTCPPEKVKERLENDIDKIKEYIKNNKIIFVTKLNRNKIYSDLFKKLGKR